MRLSYATARQPSINQSVHWPSIELDYRSPHPSIQPTSHCSKVHINCCLSPVSSLFWWLPPRPAGDRWNWLFLITTQSLPWWTPGGHNIAGHMHTMETIIKQCQFAEWPDYRRMAFSETFDIPDRLIEISLLLMEFPLPRIESKERGDCSLQSK